MAQHTVVENRVIGILQKSRSCDLEEVTRQCKEFTWNQVFLAVDHLSRSGEITLQPKGHGTYVVTFPQRQEGRSDQQSLPS
ncbi:MAG: hypothetical protein OEV08_02160 [Nitrospira sp.]|nr:hypothetical protein [Nitrospira sp.]